MAHYRITLEA
ncbi:hypothetical protein V2J09_016773 [Rumex salicifolius]